MIIKFCLILSLCALSMSISSFAEEAKASDSKKNPEEKKNPVVVINTDLGDIKVELYQEKAPKTVNNFLNYVREEHYDGTIFHRVIGGFMIQGGGFTPDFKQKPTESAVDNEADNGLKNVRGTIAMARTSDPNSATAQFFINLTSNPFLDFKSKTPTGWGYTVFGKVIDGMDVVDKIAKVKTGTHEMHQDVPLEPVAITHIQEVK
jgi:peptidyl-prolyl cis-trans isomerase B (cyclophilin B)